MAENWFEPVELAFLERPQFVAGESLGGYLLRFAESNFLYGLRGLAATKGLSPIKFLDLDGAELVSTLWGSEGHKRADSRLLQSARRPGLFGSKSLGRVCVLCNREAETCIARAGWDAPMTIHCQKHRVLLLDTCQSCGMRLDYCRRAGVDRCACGARFSSQSAKSVPAWLGTVRWVMGSTPTASADERWEHEEAAAQTLVRLAKHLRSPAEHRQDRFHVSEPFITVDVLEAAGPWFDNWPEGFVRSVSKIGWAPHALQRQQMREYLNADRFPELVEVLKSLTKRGLPSDATASAEGESEEARLVRFPVAFVPTPIPFQVASSQANQRLEAAEHETLTEAADELAVSIASPSGSLPTLLICWLATEAVRSMSRSVATNADSMGRFLSSLGIDLGVYGPHSPSARVRDQQNRLLTSKFQMCGGKLVFFAESREGLPELAIGSHLGDSSSLRLEGEVLLSDWFFEECVHRSIELDPECLRVLKGSPAALHLYIWLRWKSSLGVRKGSATWSGIALDAGSTCRSPRKAREIMRAALKRVLTTCHNVSTTSVGEGFTYQFGEDFQESGR